MPYRRPSGTSRERTKLTSSSMLGVGVPECCDCLKEAAIQLRCGGINEAFIASPLQRQKSLGISHHHPAIGSIVIVHTPRHADILTRPGGCHKYTSALRNFSFVADTLHRKHLEEL